MASRWFFCSSHATSGHLNFYLIVLTCKGIKICVQENFFPPVYIIYAKLNWLALFISHARVKTANTQNVPTRPRLPPPAAARLEFERCVHTNHPRAARGDFQVNWVQRKNNNREEKLICVMGKTRLRIQDHLLSDTVTLGIRGLLFPGGPLVSYYLMCIFLPFCIQTRWSPIKSSTWTGGVISGVTSDGSDEPLSLEPNGTISRFKRRWRRGAEALLRRRASNICVLLGSPLLSPSTMRLES